MKITFAARSNFIPRSLFNRMERNEKIQLAIKNTVATETISSTIVASDSLKSFSEVSRIKHIPSRLLDAFRI